MMESVILIFFLMMAGMYLYALVCGPAVRYLGRKWEEGRQDAIGKQRWIKGQKRLADYERTKPAGQKLTSDQVAAVQRGDTVMREPQPQYSITGRRLR